MALDWGLLQPFAWAIFTLQGDAQSLDTVLNQPRLEDEA